jgi:hypothetical protein
MKFNSIDDADDIIINRKLNVPITYIILKLLMCVDSNLYDTLPLLVMKSR